MLQDKNRSDERGLPADLMLQDKNRTDRRRLPAGVMPRIRNYTDGQISPTGHFMVQETVKAMKADNAYQSIIHPIPPVFDADSEILILGSFPSVKSREAGFFYGHPQNRYWRVLALVFGEPFPETVPDRRAFLLRNHIAAWDVIGSCEIIGSSDASIRNVQANDLEPILKSAPIREIFVNGRTAEKMYHKYTEPLTGRPAVCLPSTSPANAAWSLERLARAWSVIRG